VSPGHDRGHPGERAASNVNNGDTLSLRETTDHFLHRLLTDCLNEATRRWWLKRAAQFEAARPKTADFHGRADREQLREQWLRLTRIAQACRARADVSPLEDIDPDVINVLSEAS
jgi:hypothetical protein